MDQAIQVEEEDCLIDFDFQIQSVLRVLMNKILEESRFELLEELEVINMASQREVFRQKKMT